VNCWGFVSIFEVFSFDLRFVKVNLLGMAEIVGFTVPIFVNFCEFVWINKVYIKFWRMDLQDDLKLLWDRKRKNSFGGPKGFCDNPQFSFGGVKEFLC
jgi:hypothetical protein